MLDGSRRRSLSARLPKSHLSFFPRPRQSKRGFQTFLVPRTGKGIDRKNLSLFHLNIKLKSKQYKVHFLMCCPIPVGLLSLFFLEEL